MIMSLTLLFFSFLSLSYTRGPFSRSFSISNFHRDLFQSHNFLYAQYRMATSELRSWSLFSTHISLLIMQCYAICMFFNHSYSTIPLQVVWTSQVPIFKINHNIFSINHFIFTWYMLHFHTAFNYQSTSLQEVYTCH